jgi:hypothetical protein
MAKGFGLRFRGGSGIGPKRQPVLAGSCLSFVGPNHRARAFQVAGRCFMRYSFGLLFFLSACATPGLSRWQPGRGGPSDPSQPGGGSAQQDVGSEDELRGLNKIGAADLPYTCPMHPEVSSPTAEQCPKCGMILIKKVPKAVHLHCPMHKEVTADAPGSCRICGMTLVPDGDLDATKP